MHKSVIIGLLLLTASLFGVATLNNIFSNAMTQGYNDNSNYGDSSYSKYQTDDKKYECRTGPFEGFFVSSVEFCKHVKFDDKKDNRVDNRTGTQGPPGPSGITILNGSNYYVQTGNFATMANNTAASFASCLTGDGVISGSYDIFFPSPLTGQYDVRTFGSTGNPPTSWATNIVGLNGIGVTTSVNCFDNSP